MQPLQATLTATTSILAARRGWDPRADECPSLRCSGGSPEGVPPGAGPNCPVARPRLREAPPGTEPPLQQKGCEARVGPGTEPPLEQNACEARVGPASRRMSRTPNQNPNGSLAFPERHCPWHAHSGRIGRPQLAPHFPLHAVRFDRRFGVPVRSPSRYKPPHGQDDDAHPESDPTASAPPRAGDRFPCAAGGRDALNGWFRSRTIVAARRAAHLSRCPRCGG